MKKHLNIRYNRNNILFFFAYALLILYRILKSSTLGINDYGITYIIISLFFLGHILSQKYKLPHLVIAVCALLSVIVYILRTSDPVLPVVLLGVIACKNIDFNSIVKQSFNIMVPMVIVIVLLASAGIINDTLSYRVLSGKTITCHGLGFNHSSALPTYYCFIFIEYLYLRSRKKKIIETVLWLLGGYIIYYFCAERLRFNLLFIIVVLMLFEPMVENRFYKFKNAILTWIYPVSGAITLFLGYIYDKTNSIMYSLNIVLSNRLYFEHYSFENYQITLFGQSIKMGNDALFINGQNSYFYIDSAYVFILFSYGIIWGLAILITFILGARKSVKVKNYILMIWFFVMAIDSMIGNQMLSIWCSPILLFPFCKYNE